MKYYRVREKEYKSGKKVYKVESADNLWELLTGVWEGYAQQNDTLDKAIEQIEIIDSCQLKSDKVVHKEKRD